VGERHHSTLAYASVNGHSSYFLYLQLFAEHLQGAVHSSRHWDTAVNNKRTISTARHDTCGLPGVAKGGIKQQKGLGGWSGGG
jgi:hypothetical protein